MKKKKRTIRFQLGCTYGLFVFFLLLTITGCTFYLVTKNENQNIDFYGETLIKETINSIDAELQKYEMCLQIANNNQYLLDFAETDHSSQDRKNGIIIQSSSNDLYSVLTSLTNTIGNINSLGIFLEKGSLAYFLGIPSDIEIDQNYMDYVEHETNVLEESGGLVRWAGKIRFQERDRVLLLRYLVNYHNLEKIGILVLNLEHNYVEQMLRKTELGRNGIVFLLDSEGQIVAASNNEIYEQWKLMVQQSEETEGSVDVTINNEKYRVLREGSCYTGWQVVGLISEAQLQGQRFTTRTVIVVISLVGMLISLFLSFVIAGHIAQPIEHLRDRMLKVSSGRNLRVAREDIPVYEIQELSDSFVSMLKNIDDLVIKNQESELREKEAQLQALQAQINPHFLYNTLNTINYMLVLADQTEIGMMVVYLGDLLRSSLEDTRRFITLEEELALVEKYLYIQNVRFGEEIHYQIDVPKYVMKKRVMRLMLQPLVENAISHGLDEKKGNIHIYWEKELMPGGYGTSLGQEKEGLILSVADDGCGMTEEMVKAVLERKIEQTNGKHHIGIYNVDHRIKLFYGEEYGLRIFSRPGAGTKISIIIPSEENINEDENPDCR